MSRTTNDLPRITEALVIDEPWISKILRGEKTWEMRSTHCTKRGWVGLVRKGSGTVVGLARLVDSRGPLGEADLRIGASKHYVPLERLLRDMAYDHAWVFEDARALPEPVPYRHRPGAVIWVRLDPEVSSAITAVRGTAFSPTSSTIRPPSTPASLARPSHPVSTSVTSRRSRPAAGVTDATKVASTAEAWLAERYPRIHQPTKYIAGFSLGAGRELALERNRQRLQVWIGSIPTGCTGCRIVNVSNPGQPYAPEQSRNSNLRTQAPTLAEGHRAYCLELEDLRALERLVDA